MLEKKLLLIVNPVAGIRRVNNMLLDIVQTFCEEGYECTTQTTTPNFNARDIVKSYGLGKDIIVCIGGDGTFNEMISGCIEMDIRPQLGYIPSGTTNDFANSMELSLNPRTAAHNIVKNKTKELDIGSFNGRVFAYTASFGMFTKASYSTRREMKNSLGYFAYVLSGAKELGDIHSYNVKITSGDKIVEGEYIFGGICNSKRIGGLFQLPQDIVDMNDGLLEALFIKMPQNAHEFMQLIFDLNTNNFDSTMFDFYSTENLIVETNENIDWTIDGEYQKGDKKVEIKALKSAIQLIV
jgi:YegS/Rv2252/BmrU family lipid kinase